jgi:UDP-N-acetylglucosamine--N-acetylmuramyl-(pentapeptide) pyrophosphoryl-undecaprenol N-acetylglucosamine transferase
LTVAERISAEGHDEVAFIGTPGGLEARLASEAGLPFFPINARGWDRSKPLSLLAAALVTSLSFVRSLYLLRRVRADVVVGFGGYVSLPLGLAAALASVPLVLHEQNSVPGVANRILSRWATAVCVTYPDSIHRLARASRATVTGDPVRPSIIAGDEKAARTGLKLTSTHPVMLVFGGSQGARHLNEATVDLYSRLSEVKGLQVVQATGPAEIDSVRERLKTAAGGRMPRWWKLVGYLEDMGDALAAADLVVCRSGATTIAELTAAGKAAVLVPYPYATDDHQTHNASPLREAGASIVVRDSDLDAEAFGEQVVALLRDAPRRARMARAAAHLGRPNAAQCIADVALEAATAHSPWRLRMPKTLRPLSAMAAPAVAPMPASTPVTPAADPDAASGRVAEAPAPGRAEPDPPETISDEQAAASSPPVQVEIPAAADAGGDVPAIADDAIDALGVTVTDHSAGAESSA